MEISFTEFARLNVSQRLVSLLFPDSSDAKMESPSPTGLLRIRVTGSRLFCETMPSKIEIASTRNVIWHPWLNNSESFRRTADERRRTRTLVPFRGIFDFFANGAKQKKIRSRMFGIQKQGESKMWREASRAWITISLTWFERTTVAICEHDLWIVRRSVSHEKLARRLKTWKSFLGEARPSVVPRLSVCPGVLCSCASRPTTRPDDLTQLTR